MEIEPRLGKCTHDAHKKIHSQTKSIIHYLIFACSTRYNFH